MSINPPPINEPNMPKMSYQDVQNLIRETDQMRDQLNYLIQQSDILMHSILDLEGSSKTLKEIQIRNEGEKILLPLGSHILIEAAVFSKETVLFDIGSNVVQQINYKVAVEKIQDRLKSLKDSKNLLGTQISQMQTMIIARENFLNKIVPVNNQ